MTKKKPIKIDERYSIKILESIADGVFTVDENMVITFFNKAAERITGITSKQAVGQYCYEVLRSNICETICPMRCSIQTEKEIIDSHKNILTSDGIKKTVSISTSVMRNEKGKVIGGVETFRDLSAIEELKKEITQKYTFEDIISKNHQILQIFDILPNIAESDCTVLIEGPSGSGKELFARAIHNLSHRKNGPFVAINCGALPDTLLESELFGYVKGAFTDAKKDKPGRFALAKKGTIFLDEIDSLPKITQVKLLRVLQEKEFEPLGAIAPTKTDVRIIAATKLNIAKLVAKDDFRDDLFFRLNVVQIQLPSLSKRRDDIPLLANHFIERFNYKMNKSISGLSNEVIKVLLQYDYPGNIRELENIIEHAFVMCQNHEIDIQHLPNELLEIKASENMLDAKRNSLQNAERQMIIESLERNNWNKIETANDLGYNRSTLWRKMKKLGISQA